LVDGYRTEQKAIDEHNEKLFDEFKQFRLQVHTKKEITAKREETRARKKKSLYDAIPTINELYPNNKYEDELLHEDADELIDEYDNEKFDYDLLNLKKLKHKRKVRYLDDDIKDSFIEEDKGVSEMESMIDELNKALIIKLLDDVKKYIEQLKKARGRYNESSRFNETDNTGYRLWDNHVPSIYNKNSPVFYYFDNYVTVLDDVENLINSVFQKEVKLGHNLMRLYTDFGMIIQEELNEDKKTKYKYNHNPATDRNVATTI
jgi:hypothetical protein